MANEVATVNERSRDLAAYFASSEDKFLALMVKEDVPRFMRTLNNAILRDPQIAEASKQSIFLECQKAATDGLLLDGREAALTRFKTKRGDQGEVAISFGSLDELNGLLDKLGAGDR